MTHSGQQIRRELTDKPHYATLALTDPLTGLPNRRALYDALQAHYTRRSTGAGMGILPLDLDHFKDINDTYGHDIGDRVLQHVAGILRGCAEPQDQVARWGGEEFLMLVAAGDRRALEQRAQEVIEVVHTIHSGLPPVTLSVGIAHGREAPDVDTLLRVADRRMYRAKRSGRDRINNDTLLNLPDARSS